MAAITTTPCKSSSPSISARSVLTTRSVTAGSPRPPPRAGARLSISSMKITVGATCRARWNRRETCCSDSPYHFDRRSEDFVATKFASDSRATALASSVLPVPGARTGGSPWPPDADAAEGLRRPQRQLDALAQAHLGLGESPDIVPGHVRHLIMISRSADG